jgi:hypothetical protein
MATIDITPEIRENMNTVLNALRQICTHDGSFEFDELKSTGLSRTDVMQAIAFLNDAGQCIRKEPVRLFGCTMYQWCWRTVYENKMKVARESAQCSVSEPAVEETAPAVAPPAAEKPAQSVDRKVRKPAKELKELRYEQVLDRAQVGEYVIYTVLSSDGRSRYHTTLVAGIATGCDCPAGQHGRNCYHRAGVEAYERFHQAWEAPVSPTVVESPAQQQDRHAVTVASALMGESFAADMQAHVEDSISSGDFEPAQVVRGSCNGCGRSVRRHGFCARCAGVAA